MDLKVIKNVNYYVENASLNKNLLFLKKSV